MFPGKIKLVGRKPFADDKCQSTSPADQVAMYDSHYGVPFKLDMDISLFVQQLLMSQYMGASTSPISSNEWPEQH